MMKKINVRKGIMALLLTVMISGISFGQEKPQLNDLEIASVAVVANQIDISYAEIALKRSKNKEIRDFAIRMKDDHNAVIGQAVALVKKLNVSPKDNAVSQSLLKSAETTRAMLEAKSAKEFDKAYIDNEVAYHKAVIAAVKDLLVPQTKNAELKALLDDVLPALEMHLSHAQMVQQKFLKS